MDASGPARQKSAAEKLLGDNFDPKFRERVLHDLNKFPQAALQKLSESGWSVSMVDNKVEKDGTKEGGCCLPIPKRVEVDRAVYAGDKDGKMLLHEIAHALDIKGVEAPRGLLGKLLGKAGNPIFASHGDSNFVNTYQKFQAQNLISMGHQAMTKAKEAGHEANSVAISSKFQGKGQVSMLEGQLVVATVAKTQADQSKQFGAGPREGVSKMEINGATVTTVRHNGVNLTAVDPKAAATMSTDWTQKDAYVASSNLPAELFAEGVAAYLASPESREVLLKQSPEVHAYVQSSMNEYLIADQR